MSGNITELREHLFETLRGLRNKEAPMEIERANAVSNIAKVIIDSAKVEVDFIRVTGEAGTDFIGESSSGAGRPQITQTAHGTKSVLGVVTTHKMK